MAEQAPKKPRRRDPLSIIGMVAVAGAAAFTSYSGLYGLAHLAGWPGKLAMMLPVTVDAYAMTATRVWLSPARLTRKARAWARGNAIGAISTSVFGNALFHAAEAHVLAITWPVVVALSAIPPIALGLTVHLWHVADDHEPEPKQSPGPAIAEPEAVHAAYPILGNASAVGTPRTAGQSVKAANGNLPGNTRAQSPGTLPAAVSRSHAPGVSGTVSVPVSGNTLPPVSPGSATVSGNAPAPVPATPPGVPSQTGQAGQGPQPRSASPLPQGRALTSQQVAEQIKAAGGPRPGVREVMRTYGLGYSKAAEALALASGNTAP